MAVHTLKRSGNYHGKKKPTKAGENFEVGRGGAIFLPGSGRTGSNSSWVSNLPLPKNTGMGKAGPSRVENKKLVKKNKKV